MQIRMVEMGEMVQGLEEGARDLVFCPAGREKLWRGVSSQVLGMARDIGGMGWTSVEVRRPVSALLH